jgi:hypothetical protein
MSKRNRNVDSSKAVGRARSSAPVKVKKDFPWGTVIISVVLAGLLIGIVAYAFANQGTGVRDLLKEDDESFSDLTVLDDQGRDHTDGPVDYPDYPARPPAGGAHNAVPQQCGVYEEQVAAEHVVHSLEHGAVWVTYSPDLDEDEVDRLRDEVESDPYRILSPLPGQESPIVLTAWGRQLEVEDTSVREFGRFLDVYTNGRQTPEKGAACAGTTATGATPMSGMPGMPQPGADAPAEGEAPDQGEAEPAPEPTG